MITLENMKAHVPSKIWYRGENYYDSGAVSNLEEVSEGEWVATVEGTDEYEVEISLEDDCLTSWSCDCPYEEDICKHVVATVLAIRDQQKKASRSAFKHMVKEDTSIAKDILNQDSLQVLKSSLTLIKSNELSAFVLEYASQSPEFATALKQKIQAKTQSKTITDFRSEVQKAFNTYTRTSRSRYQQYDGPGRNWGAVFNKIDLLLEKARQLAKNNLVNDALIIATQVLRSFGEVYDEELQYNDEGEVYTICETAGDLIIDTINNHTLPQQRKDELLQELCRIAKLFPYNDYEIYDIDELVQSVSISIQPADKALALIDKLLEERQDSYALYQMVLRKVNLLYQINEPQKADEIIREYLFLPEIRRQEVDKLIANAQYDSAIRLLDEGIRIAEGKKHPGKVNEWQKIKLNIYEKTNDKQAATTVCRQLFISNRGDLIYYKKLKGLIPATAWGDFLKTMIQEIESECPYFATDCRKADLYLNEGDNDNLFHLLQLIKENQLNVLLQYAPHLRETHSEALIPLFFAHLNAYAEKNLGRNYYEFIAKALHIMKKLKGGDKAVRELVAEFRIKYKRRPAMIDELHDF